MIKAVENQMNCFPSTSSRFFGYSLLHSIAVFVFLFCSALLCSSFSSFLILILSTLLFFKVTNRKPIPVDDLLVSTIYRNVSEEITIGDISEEDEEESTESGVGQLRKNQNFVTGSQCLSSEGDSIDHSSTSEDSDVDWPFPSDVREIQAFSDDSISDDDSLIEIELPEGNYFGPKEEPNVKSQLNLPDFSPESVFPQQNLMGLLSEINEMNEEENLFEIDISMGSIKC
ncbi:hypothetical protein NE237_002851 [Protea cynaroides]|uniref:Transmembrane protein n=1 Tax=Protea cynaroides TaxID=273540 RepID=A0A9Q0KFV2_9MAGN|nr:hypothetical protein NE237_002851 [Protea cynaroides]